MFQRITTSAHGQGMGIGLATTLKIIEAHGGDLSITSDGESWTQVSIWVPGNQEATRHADASEVVGP